MIRNIILGMLLLMIVISAGAQVQTHVIGDSIHMHSNTGTGELILENNTKNVNGFLYNKGNGRTEFRKGLIKINDSLYIIGGDTLNKGTGVVPISKLTPAIGNNIIDNSNYNQEWRWNSLSGGSGLKLFSNSTAASGNTQKLFDVQSAGANATSGQSTYAGYFKNTHTGTSSTNYGLYIEASGGTNNYSIYSNSGINYLAGRTTIGTSSFLTDETLNVNGTAQVRKTFNSTTPVPASGSGTPIGVTGLITVNPGSHATRDIAGVFGNVTLQPGTGNNLPVGNFAAGLTGHLTLGDAALVAGGTIPEYQAIYASLNGQSTTGTYDNIALISTNGGMSAGATITNLYHLYLGSITGSGGVSGVTNYWGIYQAGGLKNYFGNKVLIGTSTDAGDHKLQVAGNAYINGKQSIGTTSNTALLHLAAGTATASTAPLKFTSGTNLTTPENGTVEYDGTNYFVTSANTRYTMAKTLTTTATLNFTNTAAQNSSDLTVTVTGVADGDAVSIGVPNAAINNNSSYSAWVSAANTVTIRFNNFSSAAIDPASGTFRVSVIKY